MKKLEKGFNEIVGKNGNSVNYWVIPDSDTSKKGLSIIITYHKSETLFGFSIIQNNKLNKLYNWEHLLIDVKDINTFIDVLTKAVKLQDGITGYVECSCHSELLRVFNFIDDRELVIDVFDNYMLKCKKGLKSSIELDYNSVRDLIGYLQDLKKIAAS